MSRSRDRSILYRLIAAGQLAHQALLAPALARGLEPGDDAVLYLLAISPHGTEAQFAADTGLDAVTLVPHMARLIERDLVARRATGPDLLAELVLTARGARLETFLSERWTRMESALFAGLKKRQRRTLSKQLKAIAEKLQV